MKLYLAMREPPDGRVRILGVFSTLEGAKKGAEGGKTILPWQEVQGIGERWWNVGFGAGDEVIYEVELDEAI